MNTKVTAYISKNELWGKELNQLRFILHKLPLEETLKWGTPTYTYKGKNVVGIAGFKTYFGMWFFQGGLLKDQANVLQNAQEGKTQAMRQWRFYSLKEINEDVIKTYVLESIDNFELGNIIKPQRKKPFVIPKELKELLSTNNGLQLAFNQFSKSKQREFVEHISSAKREATKKSRLEKIAPMILRGEGLHDKYKNC